MRLTKTSNESVFNKYWIPRKSNYEYTSEYCASKTVTKNLPHLHNPGDDISNRNAFTYCEMTKKKLYDVERIHAHTLQNAKKKREELNKQWVELENKETEFRNSFLYFETFVKENEMKRLRAKLKLEEMLSLTARRVEDINNFQRHIKEYEQAKIAMDEAIAKMRIFENFLNSVRDKYQQSFKIPTDIIKRYSSLLEARKCVGLHYENSLRELENCKKFSIKLMEEKNFIIMGLNNQIANLQSRFETATIKALESEGLVTQIKNSAVKQMDEIDEAKASIWNIYQHMVLSKKHPSKIKKEQVEEQMKYIKRTLSELAKVNQILKRRTKLGSKNKIKP